MTIVTGLANAGKTGLVYDRVRDGAAAGLAPTLVLPSEPEVRRALSELSCSAPLGVSVLQFDRYLDSLWSILGDGRAIVGRVQRTLLLQEALKAAPPEILSGSAGHHGFLRMLELVVQRAGEGSGQPVPRAGLVPENSPAREILTLADLYATMLAESSLIEVSEAHRVVADRLERRHLPPLLAVNRFGSFTPGQLAFLTRAAALGADCIVALTWAEGHPATTAADETITYLGGLPGAVIVEATDRQDAPPELGRLEEQLFCRGSRAPGMTPAGDIVFSEAAGMHGEAQRVLADIQELEISGIAPEAIAVVFRQPEAHLSAISSAFAEAGMPVDLDVRIPLVRTGLGRALSLLLAHMCGHRGRAEITGLLRSGYAWAEPADVDRFDERARKSRTVEGMRLLEDAKTTGAKTRLFLERAAELCAAPIDESRVQAWRWLIADMLRSRYGAPAVLDAEGMADANAQRAIITTIEEMTSLGHRRFVPGDLREALDSVDVSLAPGGERPGHVQVMSAERARSRRFDTIILGGLVGGEFPERASEDALSMPDLVGAMARAGVDVAPRGGADEERMLFYQVATGARKKLILSRAVVDDDGRPVRASVLWEEVMDLYRDATTGDVPPDGSPRVRRLELADLTEHEDAPVSERRSLRERATTTHGGAPRVQLARRRAHARTGCVTGPIAEDLAGREVFSASDIEAYLGCPYRWFYERELGPRPLDEPIDALERGLISHEIMRVFYEAWGRDGHARVTPEHLGAALEVLADVSKQVLAARPGARTLLEDEVLRGAVSGARRIVERDATFLDGFTPTHHEWSFGRREGDQPEPIGSFFLRGRIDRIDVSPEGIVIVDYKTGGSVTAKAKLAEEGLVQLPLYGLAASRRLGLPFLGGLYRSMRYGGDRGFYRSDALREQGLARNDACEPEEFEAVMSDAVAAAEGAVAGMRAGRIPASPHKAGTCEYCSARSVCGGWAR